VTAVLFTLASQIGGTRDYIDHVNIICVYTLA